jgi:DNA repair exonuclease SbcCD ATPase subunit
MPLSPQEVRAQKDMARALYAAENAKTEQALSKERDKGIALQLQHEALKKEAGRLASEAEQLHGQIDDMSVEAGDLRSRLRREEGNISQLKSALRISEQAHTEKAVDIAALQQRIDRMALDADNLKIDLAARETEVESLRFRLNGLRTERDTLRSDIAAMTSRAKEAEMRLGQEELKVTRLEDKLNREMAANADKQAIIDRRSDEVSRLKEKLKTSAATARDTVRAAKRKTAAAKALAGTAAGTGSTSSLDPVEDASAITGDTTPTEAARDMDTDIALLGEQARNRSAALSERLLKARSTGQDAALRDEIATIAASMVALTVMKEGENSPIHALLDAGADKEGSERKSLADRAAALLERPPV